MITYRFFVADQAGTVQALHHTRQDRFRSRRRQGRE